MAKKRPSPIALVQAYFDEGGAGAESTGLLADVAAGRKSSILPVDQESIAVPVLPSDTPTIPIQPTNQQDNKQTNQPANYPTNQPDSEPDTKPVSYPVTEPVDNPAISGQQTKEPVSYPANDQANRQDKEPVSYPANKPVTEPVKQSTIEPVSYPVHRPVNHPDNTVDPEMWYPFTEKQGKILLYLLQAGGVTKREHIANDTGVNIATVKHTLRVLAADGYINNIQLYTNHSYRGFSYGINTVMCAEFAERLTGQALSYPDNQPVNYPVKQQAKRSVNYPVHRPVSNPVNGPVSSPDALFSSSSRKEEKLTTTENLEIDELLKDPELGYWKGKGVNARQITLWSEEFQMPIDQVIQSLKYCRYEMVVLNLEEEKHIAKPENWFYRVIQKSGVYPKPASYKSLAEIRVEQMEQAVREATDLRSRQAVAEQELAFQRILENPAGEDYQALLRQVSEFAKDSGGMALDLALRDIFFGTKEEGASINQKQEAKT